MQVHTKKFGTVEVDETKMITFSEGIPGFEQLQKYIMLEEGDGVFYYLQSLEDDEIAFPIVDPYLLKKDYTPHIHESYFQRLGGGTNEEFTLFVITTIRENMEDTTVNLQAPLMIHAERKIGVQVISDDISYQSKHRIMDLIQERSE